MIKMLTISRSSSRSPARVEKEAIPKASPPAESVPSPRLNPLLRVAPMLNSKTTTTVRIAQTEYRPTSSNGSLRKIKREISVKARPNLAANTALRGSDWPISMALEKKSRTSAHEFAHQARTEAKHDEFAGGCWRSSSPLAGKERLEKRSLSLSPLSKKECVMDPIYAAFGEVGNPGERENARENRRTDKQCESRNR